nr:MAG TPA: hypothetical protein [Bacteriophage sp.]
MNVTLFRSSRLTLDYIKSLGLRPLTQLLFHHRP